MEGLVQLHGALKHMRHVRDLLVLQLVLQLAPRGVQFVCEWRPIRFRPLASPHVRQTRRAGPWHVWWGYRKQDGRPFSLFVLPPQWGTIGQLELALLVCHALMSLLNAAAPLNREACDTDTPVSNQ